MIDSYTYTGRDRRGGGHVGRTSENPASFIEKRYNRGWRGMSMVAASDGREVGGIVIPPGYKRTWWAEDTDPSGREPEGSADA